MLLFGEAVHLFDVSKKEYPSLARRVTTYILLSISSSQTQRTIEGLFFFRGKTTGFATQGLTTMKHKQIITEIEVSIPKSLLEELPRIYLEKDMRLDKVLEVSMQRS